MILGCAHLPPSMFNLCEETLSCVKEYLNLGILQLSRYGLNLKPEMLKRFEEKSDNTVKLCLSNLPCYNAITRVNTPSYHTTKLQNTI